VTVQQRELEGNFPHEMRFRALYSLQQIPAARLIDIINNVLSGKELLTNMTEKRRES
jgi:hypothetical protein